MNIAIAGCGPAGLAAALLLARDGHQVTIFERFDAPRPVGSGLMIQPTGLAVLRALALDQPLIAASARIDRLFGQVMPAARTVLDVRYANPGPTLFGLGVHRATLFRLLHEAVTAANIPIRTSHAVQSLSHGTLSFTAPRPPAPSTSWSTPSAPPPPRPPDRPNPRLRRPLATLDLPPGFDPTVLAQRYIRASRMVGVLPSAPARPPSSGPCASMTSPDGNTPAYPPGRPKSRPYGPPPPPSSTRSTPRTNSPSPATPPHPPPPRPARSDPSRRRLAFRQSTTRTRRQHGPARRLRPGPRPPHQTRTRPQPQPPPSD